MNRFALSALEELEAEAIHVFREVVATCDRPVLLYSVGKDSSVLLHIAKKAFAPAPLPFPLLHVDTTFKFPEMIGFRDRVCEEGGLVLHVETNQEALESIGPMRAWRCEQCAELLKTRALLGALRRHRFDAAFGGARRDEERSRAKERVLSLRDSEMLWNPRRQRPELWNLYNTNHLEGESFRVFPLSNFTEVDIWRYIKAESIEVVSLYFAALRAVVRRNGLLLNAEDPRNIREGEIPETMMCRYRTLGCQLCTGAVESNARTIDEVIRETIEARESERRTRAVDHGRDGAMEDKKRRGYF